LQHPLQEDAGIRLMSPIATGLTAKIVPEIRVAKLESEKVTK
jgi:hypothetical protein